MKIPKGTLKSIFARTHDLYFRRYGVWLKAASPALFFLFVAWMGFWNNSGLLWRLNEGVGEFREWISWGMGFCLAVVMMLSVISVVLAVNAWETDRKSLRLGFLYRNAFDCLGPLILLKIRYIFHVIYKTLFLIIPGFLAAIDASAYEYAFLIDHKEGREAIDFSRKIVMVKRFRYLDYMLLGFFLPYLFIVGFVLAMDPALVILDMNDHDRLVALIEFFHFIVIYHALIYFAVFHYSIYQTFKNLRDQPYRTHRD